MVRQHVASMIDIVARKHACYEARVTALSVGAPMSNVCGTVNLKNFSVTIVAWMKDWGEGKREKKEKKEKKEPQIRTFVLDAKTLAPQPGHLQSPSRGMGPPPPPPPA